VLPLSHNIRIDILASGSKGNSALLRSPQSTVLIDAGLSHRELGRRLTLLGCDLAQVEAVFVTHAHTDHVRALKLLSRRSGLSIMASADCLDQLSLASKKRCRVQILQANQAIDFADLHVLPLATAHDAAGSLAFRFDIAHCVRLGWATDLGCVDDALLAGLDACHYLGLEANHDLEMLQQGPYPWFLKQRVSSDQGHLSNVQSADLLQALLHPGLRQVVALHLSEKNNVPNLAQSALKKVLDASGLNVDLRLAAQDQMTAMCDWSCLQDQ